MRTPGRTQEEGDGAQHQRRYAALPRQRRRAQTQRSMLAALGMARERELDDTRGLCKIVVLAQQKGSRSIAPRTPTQSCCLARSRHALALAGP
jgi:hypothetical protein